MSVGAQMLKDAVAAIEDRHKTYGPPVKNFAIIAQLWGAYLGAKFGHLEMIDGVDVAAMMRLVKEARLIESPDHRDSYVDIAGYAACGAEVTADPEHKTGGISIGLNNDIRAEAERNADRNHIQISLAGMPGMRYVDSVVKGCSCRICEVKRAKERVDVGLHKCVFGNPECPVCYPQVNGN